MKHSFVKDGRLPIFKERLNELLGNMSITEFAKKLGLSRQTTGFYLNGDRIPDIEMLCQICSRCNVSADWLLGIRDDPSNNTTEQNICDITGLSSIAIQNLAGMNEYGSRRSLETINMILEQEDLWKFFVPECLDFSGINLINLISTFIHSPELKGKLLLTEDGTLIKATEGYNGTNRLTLGEIPANELVDKARIAQIESALKQLRSLVQQPSPVTGEIHTSKGD